jgi:hypothetical protein
MKRLLMGLAALPFAACAAMAAQPLTNQQMDRVTAGFSASSTADATGLVSPGQFVTTTTASLAEVLQGMPVTVGEISVTPYTSIATASSSTTTGLVTP